MFDNTKTFLVRLSSLTKLSPISKIRNYLYSRSCLRSRATTNFTEEILKSLWRSVANNINKKKTCTSTDFYFLCYLKGISFCLRLNNRLIIS